MPALTYTAHFPEERNCFQWPLDNYCPPTDWPLAVEVAHQSTVPVNNSPMAVKPRCIVWLFSVLRINANQIFVYFLPFKTYQNIFLIMVLFHPTSFGKMRQLKLHWAAYEAVFFMWVWIRHCANHEPSQANFSIKIFRPDWQVICLPFKRENNLLPSEPIIFIFLWWTKSDFADPLNLHIALSFSNSFKVRA